MNKGILGSLRGRRDSIHHHLPEAISETATVLELKQVASMHHPLWVVVVVVVVVVCKLTAMLQNHGSQTSILRVEGSCLCFEGFHPSNIIS